MFLRIDPSSPEPWLVAKVAQILREDGVAVLPTDTLYGIACRVGSDAATKRIRALKGLDPKKPLALLLPSAGDATRWTRAIDNSAFRLMKRVLPGPYTFIFQASAELPRVLAVPRKTVGIRVPDCAIVQAVLAELREPLMSTSVRDDQGAFVNDPLAIEELLGGVVDVVVDGGSLGSEPSTIVDLSSGEPELVRVGKGDVTALNLA